MAKLLSAYGALVATFILATLNFCGVIAWPWYLIGAPVILNFIIVFAITAYLKFKK